MKRIIVDYSKLTNEILNLLVEKFPDGYDDSNIIRFRNHKDEAIEAVEVKTEDTIYLVKISTKLSERMVNYDEDDEMEEVPEIDAKALNMVDEDDDSDDDDDEIDMKKDPETDSDNDGDDDDDDDFEDIADDDSDDDDED
jgi:DNA-directed RNA polymerase subunit delta